MCVLLDFDVFFWGFLLDVLEFFDFVNFECDLGEKLVLFLMFFSCDLRDCVFFFIGKVIGM